MSPREFAEQVVSRLTQAGFTALWAGGCVRDLLLGRDPKDYDVATSARPEQVREVFGKQRTLNVGESFGVMIVLGPKSAGQIEVATFRTDGCYIDGRRPEHVVFSSPEEDAKRRDFTINGMFYDPLNREVLDYVGGEHDLAAGLVRAIGDPQARMSEDKLRMLRAVRFASTFEFALDEATAEAVRSMADQITVVSAERIAQELRRMLVDRHRHIAITLCHDVGLLLRILPGLEPVVSHETAWQYLLAGLRLLQEPSFALAFAFVFDSIVEAADAPGTAGLIEAADVVGDPPDDAETEEPGSAEQLAHAAGRRLKLSNQEIGEACWLLKNRDQLNDAANLPLSMLKRILAHRQAPELIALIRVRALAHDRHPSEAMFCEEFLRTTPAGAIDPPPLISGGDLIKAGFRPGPQFKEILEQVRDAQLEHRISSSDEAMQLVEQLTADD